MSELVTAMRDFRMPSPYTLALPDGYKANREWPLVIALHGMGQHEDLMRRAFAPLLSEPWIFCFPRAVHPYEIHKDDKTRIGYAWYVFDGDQDALRASMALAGEFVLGLQDSMRKQYTIGKTAIVGFSQGGYLAAVVAAQSQQRFRAAASLCGRLKWEFMPPGNSVKLAQFHGSRDENVSAQLALQGVEGARERGYETEYFEDPEAGHEMSLPMLERLREWLRGVIT
jgi:predicted esterase